METDGILLTPSEYAATVQRVAKINARAVAKGFTGRLEVSGEQVQFDNRRGVAFPQLPRGGVLLMSTVVTGQAPCYGGWRFLAALDELPGPEGVGTNWIVRCAPGVSDERVDRDALVAGHCGHCRTLRWNRRHTYLVENADSGELVQVGSRCLNDFTGWQGRLVFLSADDAELEDDGERTYADPAVGVADVLAYAVAAVQLEGWVPMAGAVMGRAATADLVQAALFDTSRDGDALREHLEAACPPFADVAVMVEVLLEALTESHGYEANLRAALTAGHITAAQIPLVASAVVAYDRIRGDRAAAVAAKAAAAAKPATQWLGQLGEPVQITGVVTTAMTVDGFSYRSTQRLVVIEDGPTLAQAYTAARWAYDVAAGDTVTVTATVKGHVVYREQRQTQLTRVKRVA